LVGRPKKITDSTKKQIRSLISANEHISSRGISAALATGSPRREAIKVSAETIRRNLVEMNYKHSTPLRVPKLTEKQKLRRVEWCKKHRKFDWNKVFFSDETSIELDRCKLRQWHPKAKRPTKATPKYSSKRMFWSAISATRTCSLVPVTGTLNSQGYIELLGTHLLPWLAENRLQQHYFQQDNASCHVSRLSQAFFRDKELKILDWPANSPDLNPIENIWGILKDAVEKRAPKTLAELEAFAIDEWGKIPLQIIRNTIASMPRRINQVLDRGGEKCDY